MFERIATSWELARQSWQVLKLDKELLVFPLISGIACMMVMASFAVPLFFTGYGAGMLDEGPVPNDPIAYAILFAFYFVNYFVVVFFNSALVACAVIRFKGGNPTVADGLRAATSRLPQILGWALLSASVGVVLKVIESRSEKAGQIVAGLAGMAWSAATYFVVPVLVIERLGPVEAVKRSLAVLRKTWGEALVANFGIGVLSFLLTLPAIALAIAGVVVLITGKTTLGIALLVTGLLSILLISLASSALNTILIAALYLYAAEDQVPQQFDRQALENAFSHK